MTEGMPFPACVPVLTDGVVALRAHRREDIPRIVEQCKDAQSVAWTTVPVPYGPQQAREFLDLVEVAWNDPDGGRYFAICAADDPQSSYLGTIDLRPKGAGIASVGFGLHPTGRGQGLMTRALRLLARHWFEDRNGVRLVWHANRGNFASWRVAWACGFTFHSATPQQLPQRGQAVDSWTASVGAGADMTTSVAPWWEAVVLESAQIRLRPWRESDVVALEPGDTPEHFMPAGAQPTASTFGEWLLVRRERMAFGQGTVWCIADASTDRALGQAVLIHEGQERGSAELGYHLFPCARGNGAATTAARLLIPHAFEALARGGRGLRRLTALTVGDNDPSAAVLERLGFTQWGREPAFCERADGSFDDARHWVLIRDDSA